MQLISSTRRARSSRLLPSRGLMFACRRLSGGLGSDCAAAAASELRQAPPAPVCLQGRRSLVRHPPFPVRPPQRVPSGSPATPRAPAVYSRARPQEGKRRGVCTLSSEVTCPAAVLSRPAGAPEKRPRTHRSTGVFLHDKVQKYILFTEPQC